MARLFVIFICIGALIVLLPVWIIMFALVFAEDRGSPIFKQERVGKKKKPFNCYKVRTMRLETEDVASHHASTDGITKVGAFLRRTGLDELPQIVNVLKGDMSFVGPRPCLPVQTQLIAAREAEGVYDILPGVTGLAQIQGVDMSNPEKLARIDGEYVRIKSLAVDLQIIGATLRGKGSGDAIKPAK